MPAPARATDASGQPITRYLKHNSPEEREARAALARRVRDSMSGFSGELLALAIDPLTPSSIPGMKPTRRVRFESPARGKSSTWARDSLVVDFIRRRRFDGWKQEAAIAAAMKQFGMKRSAVQAAWAQHQKLVSNWKRRASK
jgi:hypothetical protein